MTKRQKKEIYPTLKPKEDKEDPNAVLCKDGMEVTFKAFRDISTKNGEKLVADVVSKEGKGYSVFLNSKSENNLIDSYGEDDENWKEQKAILKVENAPEPFQKQLMIVAYPK